MNRVATGILYLIPSSMGEGAPLALPAYALAQIKHLRYFVTEQAKTARHFIKTLGLDHRLQDMHWEELNRHTPPQQIMTFLAPLLAGEDLGLLSEAGCPGVADPGAELVSLAQQKGIRVVPLVGPSSILLGLMGSGLNGQCFAFQGYLPIKSPERRKALQHYEQVSRKQGQTQIFIETPYRNAALWEDMLQSLAPDTRVCLALDLLLPSQDIRTKTVADWKKDIAPDLHKRLCVFLFLAD